METLSKALDSLGDLTKLFVFVVVIVPGFVSLRFYDAFRGGQQRKVNDSLVDVIVYGFVSAAVWLPATYAVSLIVSPWLRSVSYVAAVGLYLGLPILLAFAWYEVQKKLAAAGTIADLDPKPWDRIFTAIKTQSLDLGIILTLGDGRRIGGRFARETPGDGYASSYPADEQLLIGQQWTISAEGRFLELISGSRGLLIDKKDVLTVEFFDWSEVIADLGEDPSKTRREPSSHRVGPDSANPSPKNDDREKV